MIVGKVGGAALGRQLKGVVVDLEIHLDLPPVGQLVDLILAPRSDPARDQRIIARPQQVRRVGRDAAGGSGDHRLVAGSGPGPGGRLSALVAGEGAQHPAAQRSASPMSAASQVTSKRES